MKNLLRNFTLVVISFLAFSCGEEENKNLSSTSIAKIIEVTPEFSNLKEALDITGLTSTFEGSGDFTVFVPNNDAFAAVLGGLTVEEFETANPGVLESILKYHVLGGRVLSSDLSDGKVAATLQGQNITIRLETNPNFPEIDPDLGVVEEKSIFINESRVFARDVNCSNGIIHVINAVLQPITIVDIASNNADFSILVRALERTDLVVTLDSPGQFTVFAPTNAAFNTFFTSLGAGVTVENVDALVLKGILLNHVIGSEIKSGALPAATYASTLSPFNTSVNAPTISMFVQKSGSVVTINGGSANGGATVTSADLDACNGVIHVVGNVIAIPTIKNHAIANPNFSTLTSLLVTQNLAATLDGTAGSPFTVFAPLNSAFDTATLNLYTGLSSGDKTAVLLYHVVGGVNVRSNAIPTGNITTLQGQAFSITGTVIDDASSVNKNIVLTDVQCSNGIVHAIDKVLLPNL